MKKILLGLFVLCLVSGTAFAGRVSVYVSTPSILERQTAVFTFVNSSVNSRKATTVKYYLSGNAFLGFDYLVTGTPGEVVIPAGASSAQVTLTAITDYAFGPVKDVQVDLARGRVYSLGSPRRATLTIFEIDPN